VAAAGAASIAATGGARAPQSPLPYMLGDLLRATNSVRFNYAHVSSGTLDGPYGVEASGTISLRNTKVADNNNAFPADRFSYEYNFFKNGQSIQGTSAEPIDSHLPPPLPSQFYAPRLVKYDIGLHTLAFEKSFADGAFSLEARIPFAQGLITKQDLSGGRLNGDYALNSAAYDFYWLDVTPTPQNTWGSDGWELEDVSLILKVPIYRDPSRNLCLSAGLQVVAPTARNMDVRVTDYFTYGYLDTYLDTLGRRTRTFRIGNETWALSPFLALSTSPRERVFLNGFLQLDIPVGTDSVSYSQRYESLIYGPGEFPNNPSVLAHVVPRLPDGLPIQEEFTGRIRDQVLMHFDVGIGYWIYENLQGNWVRGIAPTVELHLTQTLGRPDVLVMPTSGSTVPSASGWVPEEAPTVGNLSRSNTFTDVTIGIDVLLGKASTLAVGAAFPLGTGHNRTFDTEVIVKFNHSF
jgi:hypothetical protein